MVDKAWRSSHVEVGLRQVVDVATHHVPNPALSTTYGIVGRCMHQDEMGLEFRVLVTRTLNLRQPEQVFAAIDAELQA